MSMNDYPKWYRDLRAKALKLDSELDWPTAKEEPWRRTDLKKIHLPVQYLDAPSEPGKSPSGSKSFQSPAPEQQHLRLAPLQEAVAGNFPGVRTLLEEALDKVENRFQARLLAEAPQGLYLYLPRNYTPSDILFLEDRLRKESEGSCACGNSNCSCGSGDSSGGSGGCGCGGSCGCGSGNNTEDLSLKEHFSLNLIVLEEGARADVWERISEDEGEPGGRLHNRGTLMLLERNASLRYHRTQELKAQSVLFDFSSAKLKENTEFYSFQAEGDILLNKSHIGVSMLGKGGKAELRGIYTPAEDHFCEIFTDQEHLASDCSSHSLYRGVLQDRSRSVYNGMIRVAPKAVKSDAYLTNNNLLLNNGCRADSIPGLKIENNDVRCSHGSTTGKMDREQLFYLMARGLSEDEARRVMTQAFLQEVMQDAHALVKREIQDAWGLEWEESA